VGPSSEGIGFALLGRFSGIVQAIQEGPQPDPSACRHFLQAGNRILQESGRRFPGCIHQTKTPLRGNIDLALSGLLPGGGNTSADGLESGTNPFKERPHDVPPCFLARVYLRRSVPGETGGLQSLDGNYSAVRERLLQKRDRRKIREVQARGGRKTFK